MNMHADLERDLQELINRQLQTLETLDALLVEERAALMANDPTQLELVGGRKMRTLGELEQLSVALKHAFADRGLACDTAAIKNQLNAHASTELAGAWSLVQTRLKTCQQQNRVNGARIEAGRRFTSQFLDILRGNHLATSVYGPNGKCADTDNRRSIATA